MARREIRMNEVMEILYQWHQGTGIKGIQKSLGYDRKTVRRYVRAGLKVGLTRAQPFPNEQDLIGKLKELWRKSAMPREAPAKEMLHGYRDEIAELLTKKDMTAKQVLRLLHERHGLTVSYSSVRRYLQEAFNLGKPEATVRLEVAPGEEAQVDFGYVGLMRDPETGKERKAWCFIMTLSYSRHRFVRFVFRQDSPTWIDCHVRAFDFFQGVVSRVILDNLKSGVIKPDLYDPRINFAYGELERHYGFVADPAGVRKAKHKGKVERTVPVVRQQLLAGREFKDILEANERALRWCRFEIGNEVHGTTKRRPYEVFTGEEKGCLKRLPEEPFEIPVWKECTVHSDHHIVFEQSYYSLPTRYIGKKVWARGTRRALQVFLDHQLIKTHSRSLEAGKWVTDQTDYPPRKLAYLMNTPASCLNRALQYGPHTHKLMEEVLEPGGHRSMRKAQAILRLGEKWAQDLERASQRALAYGTTTYRSIQAMLEKGLLSAEAPADSAPLSELGQSFLRQATYFSGEAHS